VTVIQVTAMHGVKTMSIIPLQTYLDRRTFGWLVLLALVLAVAQQTAAENAGLADCSEIVANWDHIVATLDPASAAETLTRIVDTVRGTHASEAKRTAIDAVTQYVEASLLSNRLTPVPRNELLRLVGRMLYFEEELVVQPSYGEEKAMHLFTEFLDDADCLVRSECARWLGRVSFSDPSHARETLNRLEPRYAPLKAAEASGKDLSKEGDELQRAVDAAQRVLPENDVMQQRFSRISDESYLALLAMSKEQLRQIVSTDKGRE